MLLTAAVEVFAGWVSRHADHPRCPFMALPAETPRWLGTNINGRESSRLTISASRAAAAVNQFATSPQGFRSFGGPEGQRPTVGPVKAVSSASLTVTNERTGVDSTLAIAGTAARIMLNPTMMRGPGQDTSGPGGGTQIQLN